MSIEKHLAKLSFAVLLFFAAAPALASHFRGGNVSAQVTAEGVVTLRYETLWRKGSATFPFAGIDSVRFYNETDTSRSFTRASVFVNIGATTVFRNVSDPAFDFRRQEVTIDLPSIGLAPGRYVARWQSCCRIRGIQNAPESNFSLETLVVFDGTANGSPLLNSGILNVVGKGLLYSQNLNAFDPDGGPVSYEFLVGSGRPIEGPSFHVPGITLDGDGQVEIGPFDTAILVDVNRFNPAGDYVFKVRVTDADGAFSQRDVLLDVVATANEAPVLSPIGNRVLEVGESVVLAITADDPNVVDRVTLTTSDLPDNAVFVTTPGNPASGTLAFRPDSTQVGVVGINVEARDDGTPQLTASELVTFTVLDPANACPVLSPVGNRDLVPGETLSITLSGADPDAGQSLAFSAAFLPPGAAFDPVSATFTWTPTAADAGVHLGTVFEVRDSSTPPCAARETVGFSVQPSNRFPVLDVIGDFAVTEGSMVSFTVSAADPDGDAVTLGIQPLPFGASFDPVTGELMWTPTIGQAGVYEVTVTAIDDGVPALADRDTVRIVVAPDGSQPVRFAGVRDQQQVAGVILVEAQIAGAFPVVRVDFAVDGIAVSSDTATPYFLGPEVGGQPAGFDTLTIDDGLHVISATAVDSAGQSTTAQIKIDVRNLVPPVVDGVSGVFDGSVVSGLIFVEVEASDDQGVASVDFLIDGESVNLDGGEPFFLNGGRFPEGTFDVSCNTCLQVGDRNGDLVVVGIEDDGTLGGLCSAAVAGSGGGGGTPDGSPPSQEDVCDPLKGQAFGLCNAFCEAQDCDGPGNFKPSCDELRENFFRHTEEERFPCETVGACITSLSLGWVEDPSRFATFGQEDFTGVLTRFQLPFEVPVGFDTASLTDGPHTLTFVVTDELGLTTTFEIGIFVDNSVLAPDALRVTIVDPVTGTLVPEGRVVPLAAALENVQGGVVVRFYADGRLVSEHTAAPFETSVLVPEGATGVTLHAVAADDRGPRQSAGVDLVVEARPVPPAPISVVDVGFDRQVEGRVAVDTALTVSFSGPVDAATISGVRLFHGGVEVPLALGVEPDGTTVRATPFAALEPDTLHELVVDGVRSLDGGEAGRFRSRFLTFPQTAIFVGLILNTSTQPLPGIPVEIGGVTATTDADGLFTLTGVPAGAQALHVDGGTVDGLTYPPLQFPVEITEGIVPNQLPRPIFLPALDLDGGLDVVGGVATGGGVLTGPTLPGVSLDLTGVTVSEADGTPFTGRMSITIVPPTRVPMDGLAGFSSNTYITVQPGNLHLVPPAPITYPNLEGALPGEPIPLSHYDHDIEDWVIYGTGTVTADGSSIVSNPGEGLPKTGWGCPHPPNTETTVVGTAVDKESSPLHGVRVAVGSRSATTGNDGSFTITNVPAGREGTPRSIAVEATAKDITGKTYEKTTPSKPAVQNGTTDFGQVTIDSYGPLIDDKIVLHGDWNGDDHLLKVGSSHSSEKRYEREVEELQKRLKSLGFRQGGSTTDHGKELVADGDYGENSKKAVRLFQTLELNNGGNGKLGGDGVVGKDSLKELNAITETTLWQELGGSITDWKPGVEIADAYGTPDMGDFLTDLGSPSTNDVSNPSGGDHPDHGSHETGIDADVMLPLTGGGWGGTISTSYDSTKTEDILKDAIDTGASTERFFNDTTLCAKKHNGKTLCSFLKGHNDHMHFRIDPSKVSGGVNAKAAGLPRLLTVTTLGSEENDVAVDGTLQAVVSTAFDPATLNAATVRLEGPDGDVAGDVVPDVSGLLVLFRPVERLDLATTYQFRVTTGAVLADGTLLAQPMVRPFTTEATPSVRVTRVEPAFGDGPVPRDTVVSVTFDAPVDPVSLTGSVLFENVDDGGLAVAADLSLLEGGTRLVLEPRQILEPTTTYRLRATSGLRGVDGSLLAARPVVASFTTGLPEGIERIEVEPAEVVFTREDLSPVPFQVTAFLADGSTLDLSDSIDAGTLFAPEAADVIDVDLDGVAVPSGNGETLVTIAPYVAGFDTSRRARVDGVFPELSVASNQFSLTADEDVVLLSSEDLDQAPLAVSNVRMEGADGTVFDGLVTIDPDGLALSFDPNLPLPLRSSFTLELDLEITDDLGVTRPFARSLPLATQSANGGFELGDFTDFEVQGDVDVVTSFGSLTAPEGNFMARLLTSDMAVEGRTSRLRALDLLIPVGATRMVFTYNFLTDEIEQGFPFNDFFRASLVLPDGSRQTIVEVDRDDLRFTGQTSPVPGFDRMTGYRSASVAITLPPGQSCDLLFEVEVSDAGDASIDSAVLIDDLHFE